MDVRSFVRRLPKAELHLHIEGSLEPAMLLRLADKHRIELPYKSVGDVNSAYDFSNLQDFLDIYYQGMNVLRDEEDFYQLTIAYLERIAADGVVHAEIFYDPQGHTVRGIPFEAVTDGILAALKEGESRFGITSGLIMCFLRHLTEADALATFETATPYVTDGRLLGIGLDSTELGNPPSKFARVFEAARNAGLKCVAHAGEEGPADYVRDAIDLLGIDRIDHGNRCLDDAALVKRIVQSGMALTVCPLSNQKLCVVPDLGDHPLKRMLDVGLKATVNSDDPAYFGGYLLDNYVAIAEALDLGPGDLVTLARNSIDASFIDSGAKTRHLAAIDALATPTD